eukprot:11201301-Lingulodinium_polyedra.AAC.1
MDRRRSHARMALMPHALAYEPCAWPPGRPERRAGRHPCRSPQAPSESAGRARPSPPPPPRA